MHTKNIFLAIEFSISRVKLVKMKKEGLRLSLLDARSVVIPRGVSEKELKEVWREAVRQVTTGEVNNRVTVLIGADSPRNVFTYFNLPKLPKSELLDTLKWKIKEELTFPIEEAVLDYRIPKSFSGRKDDLRETLVSVLPQSEINPFIEMVKSLGFEQVYAAQCIFSIERLPQTFPDFESTVLSVVDIGEAVTEIALYQKGTLRFLRKVAFGGRFLTSLLTQPLAGSKGTATLSWAEAERVKSEEHLVLPIDDKLLLGKVERSKLRAVIRPELERLLSELKRSFESYGESNGHLVEQMFVTGGSSKLQGLRAFLEEELHIPVKRVTIENDFTFASGQTKPDSDSYYRMLALASEFDLDGARERLQGNVQRDQLIRRILNVPVLIGFFLIVLTACGFLHYQYRTLDGARRDLERQTVGLKPGYQAAKDAQALEQKLTFEKNLETAALSEEPFWTEVLSELQGIFQKGVTLHSVQYEDHSLLVDGEVQGTFGKDSFVEFARAAQGPIFHTAALVRAEPNGDATNFTIRLEMS